MSCSLRRGTSIALQNRMSERTEQLLKTAARMIVSPPEDRRRDALAQRAMGAGHTRAYADLIYDIATEEGVDPGLAFEIVLAGVGVRELSHAPLDQWEETQVEAPPSWVSDDVFRSADAAPERRLRTTFRRLRSLGETQPSVEAMLQAFVREPDVGDVDY